MITSTDCCDPELKTKFLLDSLRSLELSKKLGWINPKSLESRTLMILEQNCFEIIPGRLLIESYTSSSISRRPRTMSPASIGKQDKRIEEYKNRAIVTISCDFDENIPPPGVVTYFMHTMRSCTRKLSTVAVQCRGAQQHAGVLCALHLMEAYGFDAGAACAWLRLTCPTMHMGHEEVRYLECVQTLGQLDGAPPTSEPFIEPRAARIRQGVCRAWRNERARWMDGAGRPRQESSYTPAAPRSETGGSRAAQAGAGFRESLRLPTLPPSPNLRALRAPALRASSSSSALATAAEAVPKTFRLPRTSSMSRLRLPVSCGGGC
jgi:hypothetical protein